MIDPTLLRETEAVARRLDLTPKEPKERSPKPKPEPKERRSPGKELGAAILKALAQKGLLPRGTE